VVHDYECYELRLHGDLDAEGAEVLHALVTEFDHVARIDLEDVETIDSSGLFALVQADTRARLSGTRLTLIPPAETVHRIFEWTGLDSRLSFVAAV
jgi:anti-anti-sigma factor